MNFKHRSILILFFSIFTLMLTACSKGNEENKTENYKKEEKKREEKATKYYPVKIVDSLDRTVTILSEPKRVISLAPNMSEMICALDRENTLVGRTALCNFPEIISNIDSVGDFYQPDIDKILSLKADLIVISSLTSDTTLKTLEENGQNFIVLNEDSSLYGTYTMIDKLGIVLNATKESDELVKEIKAKIAFIKHKVKKADKPIVYFVYDLDHTAGKNTFIGDIINVCGAINAAGDVEGWTYDLDKLKEIDPDILIAPERLFPNIRNSDKYKDLSAVKKNKLFEIDEDIISRQGPRIADGIDILARIIHPELFKD